MYELLSGLRVVEAASFIAAPVCGLHLLELGAEVIRIDMIGGGPDFGRWPLAPSGRSLYWEGLNKGKKSVAINLKSDEGKELAIELATKTGTMVTNYPADGFLSHGGLQRLREDMLTVRIMGWSDGRGAVDYTVNAAHGLPLMTGPPEARDRPVNHVFPAWDFIAGLHAALNLLAADGERCRTGRGREIRIPLSNVAVSCLSSWGAIAEASLAGQSRPRLGNDVFGTFGRDFKTADGEYVMIAAISPRNWTALVRALSIDSKICELEVRCGVSFTDQESARFEHRTALFEIVEQAVLQYSLSELKVKLDRAGVIWEPYKTLSRALQENAALSQNNPILSHITHISGAKYLTAGAPIIYEGMPRGLPQRAPFLGEHTEEILLDVLQLSQVQLGRYLQEGLISMYSGAE